MEFLPAIYITQYNSAISFKEDIIKSDGFTGASYSASFSPDYSRIVSASYDKTVRVRELLPIDELIERTTEQFKKRQLTPEEKRKYYIE